MNWENFWIILNHVANIFCILSTLISFSIWLSFGKLKKDIEREKIKYIEEQGKILDNLNLIYYSLFTEDIKTDDILSNLRKQIYSINKNFKELMVREDLKCIMSLMKILQNDTDKINFFELRKNLDFIITAFTQKSYDH